MSLSFLCVKPLLTLCCVFIPEYILGTVHKAKGLEFDTVHVLDDFVKVPCARHNLAQLPHFRVGKGPGYTTGLVESGLGMLPLEALLFVGWCGVLEGFF